MCALPPATTQHYPRLRSLSGMLGSSAVVHQAGGDAHGTHYAVPAHRVLSIFLYPPLSLSIMSTGGNLRVLTDEYAHAGQQGEAGHDLLFFLEVHSNIGCPKIILLFKFHNLKK